MMTFVAAASVVAFAAACVVIKTLADQVRSLKAELAQRAQGKDPGR